MGRYLLLHSQPAGDLARLLLALTGQRPIPVTACQLFGLAMAHDVDLRCGYCLSHCELSRMFGASYNRPPCYGDEIV